MKKSVDLECIPSELSSYIKRNYAKADSDKIKEVLIEAGWDYNLVDKALHEFEKSGSFQHKIPYLTYGIVIFGIVLIGVFIGTLDFEKTIRGKATDYIDAERSDYWDDDNVNFKDLGWVGANMGQVAINLQNLRDDYGQATAKVRAPNINSVEVGGGIINAGDTIVINDGDAVDVEVNFEDGVAECRLDIDGIADDWVSVVNPDGSVIDPFVINRIFNLPDANNDDVFDVKVQCRDPDGIGESNLFWVKVDDSRETLLIRNEITGDFTDNYRDYRDKSVAVVFQPLKNGEVTDFWFNCQDQTNDHTPRPINLFKSDGTLLATGNAPYPTNGWVRVPMTIQEGQSNQLVPGQEYVLALAVPAHKDICKMDFTANLGGGRGILSGGDPLLRIFGTRQAVDTQGLPGGVINGDSIQGIMDLTFVDFQRKNLQDVIVDESVGIDFDIDFNADKCRLIVDGVPEAWDENKPFIISRVFTLPSLIGNPGEFNVVTECSNANDLQAIDYYNVRVNDLTDPVITNVEPFVDDDVLEVNLGEEITYTVHHTDNLGVTSCKIGAEGDPVPSGNDQTNIVVTYDEVPNGDLQVNFICEDAAGNSFTFPRTVRVLNIVTVYPMENGLSGSISAYAPGFGGISWGIVYEPQVNGKIKGFRVKCAQNSHIYYVKFDKISGGITPIATGQSRAQSYSDWTEFTLTLKPGQTNDLIAGERYLLWGTHYRNERYCSQNFKPGFKNSVIQQNGVDVIKVIQGVWRTGSTSKPTQDSGNFARGVLDIVFETS